MDQNGVPQDVTDSMSRKGKINKKTLRAAYHLRCSHCRQAFSDTAMRASLLSSPDRLMYSAGSVNENVHPFSARVYSTELCECRIVDTGCTGCATTVGYCVVSPCQTCETQGNGQRYLFNLKDVSAARNVHFVWDGWKLIEVGRETRGRAPGGGANGDSRSKRGRAARGPGSVPAPEPGRRR